jgi:hypothetical protein
MFRTRLLRNEVRPKAAALATAASNACIGGNQSAR